jgi:hypothetical protein
VTVLDPPSGGDAGAAARTRTLRRQLGVPDTGFAVVLVGKDGGVKLRRRTLLSADVVLGTIDAMPMMASRRWCRDDVGREEGATAELDPPSLPTRTTASRCRARRAGDAGCACGRPRPRRRPTEGRARSRHARRAARPRARARAAAPGRVDSAGVPTLGASTTSTRRLHRKSRSAATGCAPAGRMAPTATRAATAARAAASRTVRRVGRSTHGSGQRRAADAHGAHGLTRRPVPAHSRTDARAGPTHGACAACRRMTAAS